MEVHAVPLRICSIALHHFRSTDKEARHGFVNVEMRSIEFSESAISCKECEKLMNEIDLAEKFG